MAFRNLKNSILSIGKSISKPIFVKDFDDENIIINELEKLKEKTKDEDVLNRINKDINYVKAGLVGEKNVYYELKNSFLPIVCLHNLYLKHESYEAQIDFLIITNRFICILETKKLSGDIVVNNNGHFIRHLKDFKGKIIKKEGIYSPITQNERHKKIVKDMLIKNKVIKNCPVLDMVVLANPKSIINDRYAPGEIKNRLIKYDQISRKLKELINYIRITDMPYQTIMEIAEFLKDRHVEKTDNYILSKYEDNTINNNDIESNTIICEDINEISDKYIIKEQQIANKEQLENELKKFRLQKSREEKIKPYYIFNNKQMEDLIKIMPKSKKELLKVSGFGNVKTEKYGSDIVNIILKYEH